MGAVFVCGEGASDFGSEGDHGPLYHMVWKVLEVRCPEGCLPPIRVVAKGCLDRLLKRERAERPRRGMKLERGKGRGACLKALARIFARFVLSEGGAMGVLHADVDLTNSALGVRGKGKQKAREQVREELCEAMREGFRAGDFADRGVPMVILPRSEAWLIALAQKKETDKGKRSQFLSDREIEGLPCNDKAPDGAKDRLKKMGYESIEEKNALVCDVYVPDECSLEGHRQFLADLDGALRGCGFVPG